MRIKTLLTVISAVIGCVLLSQVAHASCGQNSDILILYSKGKRIYDSNILVLNTNQIYSTRKFSSICINGICHSGQSSKGIYLVTVTDEEFIATINKMADDFIASSTEWTKRFPQDLHYSTDQHIVFQLPDLPELLSIAEQAAKEPFPRVEEIPNNFTQENCSYTRVIYYDVAERKFLRNYEKGQVAEDAEYKDIFEGTKFATNNRFIESEHRGSRVPYLLYVAVIVIIIAISVTAIVHFVRRK